MNELTPDEMGLIDMLGDWWNGYCGLPSQHSTPTLPSASSESTEVAAHVHALQMTIMARLAERKHPDVFR